MNTNESLNSSKNIEKLNNHNNANLYFDKNFAIVRTDKTCKDHDEELDQKYFTTLNHHSQNFKSTENQNTQNSTSNFIEINNYCDKNNSSDIYKYRYQNFYEKLKTLKSFDLKISNKINHKLNFTRENLENFCESVFQEIYNLFFYKSNKCSNTDEYFINIANEMKQNHLADTKDLPKELVVSSESFLQMLLDFIVEILFNLQQDDLQLRKINHEPPTLKKTDFLDLNLKNYVLLDPTRKLINELLQTLKFEMHDHSVLRNSYGSKRRLRRHLDSVDDILETELRREEYYWCSYEIEVKETKHIISEVVYEHLLMDTINVFLDF